MKLLKNIRKVISSSNQLEKRMRQIEHLVIKPNKEDIWCIGLTRLLLHPSMYSGQQPLHQEIETLKIKVDELQETNRLLLQHLGLKKKIVKGEEAKTILKKKK